MERRPEIDPELIAASYEVDGALIDWTLSLSPFERLRAATNAARGLTRFQRRDDPPEDR